MGQREGESANESSLTSLFQTDRGLRLQRSGKLGRTHETPRLKMRMRGCEQKTGQGDARGQGLAGLGAADDFVEQRDCIGRATRAEGQVDLSELMAQRDSRRRLRES
ncbi:MAG: hypothetical protein EAZ36_06155 [Verrucomicrobia bacterium]|nr:MAG: hypothetical protein EAZ36_06155 [Verrucomicrobiota bacterium]